jgi:hypothetical protein
LATAILASLSTQRNNLCSAISEKADLIERYQAPLGLCGGFLEWAAAMMPLERPYLGISAYTLRVQAL